MTSVDMTLPIRTLMEQHPEYLLAFGKLHFDYDVNQDMSLEEFCAMRHLDTQDVLAAMQECDQWSHFSEERHLQDLDVPQLIGYVLFTHHAHLKNELPFLESLAAEAVRVEGGAHPELMEIEKIFKRFKGTLEAHMKVEERLFSYLVMISTAEPSMSFDWEGTYKLTKAVHGEDEQLPEELNAIAKLSGNFSPPKDALSAYRLLLRELSRMEFKFRRHAWVETSILYPKVMALIRVELAHGGPLKI